MYTYSQDNEDWQRQRQPISQLMMVPRKLGNYHQGFNDVARDFVKLLKLQRDPKTGLITDIPEHSFKWSFECEYCYQQSLYVCMYFFKEGSVMKYLDPLLLPPFM